jgi:hypothetical protein
MFTYFSWWYYEEPVYLWRSIKITTQKVFSSFSVGVLISTLFDPWKKDNQYLENPSLNERFKLILDNLISRFVGFIVRFFTIITGLVFTAVTLIVLTAGFLAWLIMPFIIAYLLVNGLRTIANG